MKKTCVIAAAVIGLALVAPVTAHHNSPISAELETIIPEDALEQHNAVVEDVLEMGVAEMAGDAQGTANTTGEIMDPANDAAGNTCTEVLTNVGACLPGNEAMGGFGMDRSPPLPITE